MDCSDIELEARLLLSTVIGFCLSRYLFPAAHREFIAWSFWVDSSEST